jgi:taurine dioxygenase
MRQSRLQISPFTPVLGAEVRGVDLARGVDDATYDDILEALHEHQVLFFKEQSEIAPETHIELGKRFGELRAHPAAPAMAGYPEIFEVHSHKGSTVSTGDFWHTDLSCDEEPPFGSILQIHVLPPTGGDTLFANMYAAYEALSEPMKQMLDGLTALHASEQLYRGRYKDRGVDDTGKVFPTAVHPVVCTHPGTGRRCLFVNRTFTIRINELTETESDAMLGLLFDHCERPDFQIRFKWSVNDVAFWDNRCTMHHAIWDYWPEERKGRRVTIKGMRPT